MVQPIVFYDIPSRFEGRDRSWGPNTFKTRWVLNYKRLLYRTVWVEYPDIKPLSLEIGAAPTSHNADGAAFYTLPAIHDPNTGKTISDSFDIAQYLDVTYPERPVLPLGTEGLQSAFIFAIEPIYKTVFMLAAPTIARNLNPASQDYWRRTREARFGRTLEEFCPAGAEREKTFKGLEKDLGRITGNVQKNRDGGHFIMGAQPSFGDFALASIFVWARVMLNAEEYGRITAFDDGRWKAFMDSLEEYATVEDGEPYSAQRLAKV